MEGFTRVYAAPFMLETEKAIDMSLVVWLVYHFKVKIKMFSPCNEFNLTITWGVVKIKGLTFAFSKV